MPSLKPSSSGARYWRSLEELADAPEFRQYVESEFPNFLSEAIPEATRRQFLKVMGASLALGGLTACRWPREEIVPFARNPRGRVPGVPDHYATAFELGGVGTGLLVTSYEGRPIKIEGNEKHPFSAGRTDAWMQASVLDLYDPDRSQRPLHREGAAQVARTRAEFDAWAVPHFATLRGAQGAGLAVLSEASDSPSVARLRAAWVKAFPKAQWFEYEPCSRDNEREGMQLAFGKAHRAQYDLTKADIVVCLDADLLMAHPAAVRYTRDWASRRTAQDGQMNRLHVFEANYSITGSVADHRYAVRSAEVAIVAGKLAAALGDAAAALAGALAEFEKNSLHSQHIDDIAKELLAARGRGLVAVGPRQSPVVHALVAVLNAALGNAGQTVHYFELPDSRQTHLDSIAALAEQMRGGTVDTLVMLGGNPAYDAPVDAEFAALLPKVPNSLHLSLFNNETSRACVWHLPRAHYLEAWGDVRAHDGSVSVVQPLIAPLYDGRSPIELLVSLAGLAPASGYELVRQTYVGLTGTALGDAAFESNWQAALHDGLISGSGWKPATAAFRPADWADRLAALARDVKPAETGAFELNFYPDYKVYDGRFANNGWLQELPQPISKLTWDNALYLAPADADALGVRKGDWVNVALGSKTVRLPAMIQPGHAVGAASVHLGYGRGPAAGRVAQGAGFDVYPLRTRGAPHFSAGAKLSKAGGRYVLAVTQDHHAIQSAVGRDETHRRTAELLREGTLVQYRQDPKFTQKIGHSLKLFSLWDQKQYDGNKWGMAIDLAKCTGCSACVVACQSENNVPVVGKDEVERGREMHWIRIDRYYQGEPEAPAMAHQPVTCHHCENAPCEQVCPVAATVHDQEGLNVMVYNRCVGTRYCNNNCPYKVRRFNWFYNHHGPYHPRSQADGTLTPGNPKQPAFLKQKKVDSIEQLAFNPSVTVRSRGVMEKCSFCVQRINRVKITAKNERWEQIPDGLITPACAQACPAEAIVFGDLNNTTGRVRAWQEHDRSYAMLAELNVLPRLHYLARLKNPAGASVPASGGHGDTHNAEHPA